MSSFKTPLKSLYEGETRKLVVSIDIGTTFSAASFCILQPGEVPEFVEVRDTVHSVIFMGFDE
jgi:molecular chaperone DnaK (HSP70)